MVKLIKKRKFNLEGKIAIVTGSSRGIGRQVAKAYAEEGVNVALVDINDQELNEVYSDISTSFKDVSVISCNCDVSSFKEVSEMAEKVFNRFGSIDFLVNNAGIVFRSTIENLDINNWHGLMNANLVGTLYCCKAVIPFMKEQKGGKIINASSNMASIPDVGMSAYCVSKAGIEILTKVLASELAPYGIIVNAYSPGIIETRMTDSLRENRGEQKLKYISLNRFGKVEDVAKLVLFLSSDLSNYITGAVIPVDGGLLSTQNPWMAWDTFKNIKG